MELVDFPDDMPSDQAIRSLWGVVQSILPMLKALQTALEAGGQISLENRQTLGNLLGVVQRQNEIIADVLGVLAEIRGPDQLPPGLRQLPRWPFPENN
jgi:hypothetical protein